MCSGCGPVGSLPHPSQEGMVLDCVSHQLLAEWRPNERPEIILTAGFPPATVRHGLLQSRSKGDLLR